MEEEKRDLEMELTKVRNELARVRAGAEEDAQLHKGRADELDRLSKKLEEAQRDLNRERKKVCPPAMHSCVSAQRLILPQYEKQPPPLACPGA